MFSILDLLYFISQKQWHLTAFVLCCRAEEMVTPSEPKPLFQVIQTLINKLPNGQQLMEEVKMKTEC